MTKDPVTSKIIPRAARNFARNIKKPYKKAFAAIAAMFGKSKAYKLYTKAFEYVASTGCEDPSVLASELGISEEQAAELIQQIRENGDIACEDEAGETEEDESDYEDSDDDFDLGDLFKNPEKSLKGYASLAMLFRTPRKKSAMLWMNL